MKKQIVYVPVVTETQLGRLNDLVERLEAIQGFIDEALFDLSSGLDVLRDDNHPEGWAQVQIVRDDAMKRVLVVEHKSSRRQLGKPPSDDAVGQRDA